MPRKTSTQKFLVTEKSLIRTFLMTRLFLVQIFIKWGESKESLHQERSQCSKSLCWESSRHKFYLLTRLSSLQRSTNLHNHNSTVTFFWWWQEFPRHEDFIFTSWRGHSRHKFYNYRTVFFLQVDNNFAPRRVPTPRKLCTEKILIRKNN